MPLRFLLLQARHEGDVARPEEHRSFADKLGVEPGQIDCHSLLERPPTLAEARRHDAVLIGGSGDFLVSRGDLPHHPRHLEFLAELAAVGHPTFASCFGFQMLVEALDGTILHDAANAEVGTYDLHLTEAGRADPLFGALPPTFLAQMGRKDRAERLPDGFDNLAASERAPYQAFRVPGQPVWATQFHPELDRRTNLGRFDNYRRTYAGCITEDEVAAIRQRFLETHATQELLPRFVELVLG